MSTINPNFFLRDQGISNSTVDDTSARHRWYFVKESFSSKLVDQAAITDGIQPNEILIDPFSGSGTVLLAGALNGLNPIGFEVNPFLSFLSATKLIQVEPKVLRKDCRRLLHALEKQETSPLEDFSTFTENTRWGRWLFPRSVLRTFESGRHALNKNNQKIHSLEKLALIGAMMDCCNATPDGKCLRYRNNWQNNQATPSELRGNFETRIENILYGLETSPLKEDCGTVIEGDARKLVKVPLNHNFRLCVTSPPYLNSFDYSDIYRPELFLGGFVNSNASLMKVRLKTLRSHVQANWDFPQKDDFGSLYSDCISEIRENSEMLWDKRLTVMVQAYFEDMETILRGLRKRAKSNASLWIVVSTSAYAGVEVPVDLILAEIGQRCRWYLREVGVLRYLRSSSQHMKYFPNRTRKSVPLRESVVIFDASRKK